MKILIVDDIEENFYLLETYPPFFWEKKRVFEKYVVS